MHLSLNEINSLDEDALSRLHRELADEAFRWNELSFKIFRRLRELRAEREDRTWVQPVYSAPKYQRRVKTPQELLLEKIAKAASAQGLDLLDLLSSKNE